MTGGTDDRRELNVVNDVIRGISKVLAIYLYVSIVSISSIHPLNDLDSLYSFVLLVGSCPSSGPKLRPRTATRSHLIRYGSRTTHRHTHTAACTGYSPQGFLFSRAFGGPFGLSSRPPCRVLPHCCAADRFHRSTFGISLCTHSPVPYYPHTVALLCVSFYHCCCFRVKSFVDRLLISAEHHGGNSYYLYGGLERKLPWSFGSSRIFAV